MSGRNWTIWTANEGPTHLNAVMGLLHERVDWLQARGSDQWSTWHRWEPEIRQSIAQERTWLLRDPGWEPVGTITFSRDADPDFWTPDEQQTPALYLSKLATSTRYAGQGLGRCLLQFSLWWARKEQLDEVRMDVWRTATDLHRYYQEQGWTHLRTVDKPGRYSGALFTRRVQTGDLPEHGGGLPCGVKLQHPGSVTAYTYRDPYVPEEFDG